MTGHEADHIHRNRDAWNEWAAEFVEGGEQSWAAADPTWGIWAVPEAELHVLPDELDGVDAIELGCGTAYVSAWLARRGARCVGIDLSVEQLATARRLQLEHGVEFPLHEGSAEHLPFADESFDLAISEYGACLWADPYLWVPEAARVLRPGGRLIFLTNGTIMTICLPDDADAPPGDQLIRDYFGIHRLEWSNDPSVEFHLGYGDWIRLLRANGFEIEDLI
jgi:SAM-dependent methyltransferase